MSAAALPLATLLVHAADAVAAVRAGRSLNDALAATPAAARPGTQALAFEALRGLGLAQVLLRLLAPKPPPVATAALLLVALALAGQDGEGPQARARHAPPATSASDDGSEGDGPGAAPIARDGVTAFVPYAPHTLVSQAVEAAKRRGDSAGFVNAVLRRFLREREALRTQALREPLARWNHPPWWIESLERDWPDHWRALLVAANGRAPMTLRVNLRRQSVAQALERLAAAGIEARAVAMPVPGEDAAIELARPHPVTALPGFAEGGLSVQDLAAQQAARWLVGGAGGLPPLAAGVRVLDACAAPGGKTAHLLEAAGLELLALDADAARLAKVEDNLARLGLYATTRVADADAPQSWWDGRRFDAILLDAPCTASGIVRRHPDVRWLRRPEDVAALARVQARLLDALWPLLAPGGRLLYATCSLFHAEGEQQIDAFLQRTVDAERASGPGRLLGVAENGPQGVTAAPPSLATDGFFYALLLQRHVEA